MLRSGFSRSVSVFAGIASATVLTLSAAIAALAVLSAAVAAVITSATAVGSFATGFFDVDFLLSANTTAFATVAGRLSALSGSGTVLGTTSSAAAVVGFLFGASRLIEGVKVDFAYNVKTGTCNCALGHKYFGVLGRLLRRRLRLLFGSRVLLFGFYFQIGLIS